MQIHKLPNSAMSASKWRVSFAQFLLATMIGFGLALPVQAALLFGVTNLVTDDQLANPAVLTDPNLKNGWGISRSGTSPFWVSDNGTGKATLYAVNPTTGVPTQMGLVVSIPGAGNVTGQVFANVAGSFNDNAFLFVSEDGTISGWRNSLGTTAEVLQVAFGPNVYKGSAIATIGGSTYLYAANFRAGKIDVLKGDALFPNLAGNFTDPGLPSGYAPFNIQNIDGRLYVTYAKTDGAGGADEVPGAGFGFVSVFDLQGNFIARVGSDGALNAPWGLAQAPASFGAFAGDLLVGNFGDGRVNVFDPVTDAYLGQLLGTNGLPLVIDGLWGLMPGSGAVNGGSASSIYFSAGPDDERHGVFGVLAVAAPGSAAVPEPATAALIGLSLAGLGFFRRRR